ncbi:hypothetical protein BC835DRAFT_925904 [Cytidiella melzeri]|nr:hypothetical protein BC835DRAFT_925904 [Cytidiella melzeri]
MFIRRSQVQVSTAYTTQEPSTRSRTYANLYPHSIAIATNLISLLPPVSGVSPIPSPTTVRSPSSHQTLRHSKNEGRPLEDNNRLHEVLKPDETVWLKEDVWSLRRVAQQLKGAHRDLLQFFLGCARCKLRLQDIYQPVFNCYVMHSQARRTFAPIFLTSHTRKK